LLQDDYDLTQGYDALVEKIVGLAHGQNWESIYPSQLSRKERALLLKRKTGIFDILKALGGGDGSNKRSSTSNCQVVETGDKMNTKRARIEDYPKVQGMNGDNNEAGEEEFVAVESSTVGETTTPVNGVLVEASSSSDDEHENSCRTCVE
jgi:hypothetical protein